MSEWKEYRLDDFAKVIMGLSPSGDTYNEEQKGVPLLNGPTEFGDTHPNCTIYTTDSKRICKTKDLIFCVRGSTTGRMNWADKPYSLGRGVCSITGKDDLTTKFLKHLLTVNLEGLLQITSGGTFPNLKKEDINGFTFRAPIAYRKIAKILSNYDDLIENNLKRIKLLEESARLTYEEWFLRFRIDGKKLDIDPESGLPFGWEKVKLTDVIKLNPLTKTEKGVEHPFISMRSLSETNMVITNIEKRIPKGGAKFKNLDTLLARITPCLENGKTGFVQCLQDNEVATGSTEFIVMRATEAITPYYIYSLARTDGFREIAIQSMSGSDGRQRVKVKVFDKILLNIPTKEVLHKYHSDMEVVFSEVQVLVNKNQLLTEARDILLPRLMTGMINADKLDIAV